MKRFCLIALVCVFLAPSCRYEDGPFISFRSKEKRVCGQWVSSKVMVNGNLLENEGGTRMIEFTEEGKYADVKGDSISGFYTNQGTWAFSDNRDSLVITVKDEFTSLEYEISWEILKLACKELRLKNATATTVTEWWLERAS
jgi:hypothetical protein